MMNHPFLLARDKNDCFTEKCSYSFKALKAFYVKIVIPLWISLCQKRWEMNPILLKFYGTFFGIKWGIQFILCL